MTDLTLEYPFRKPVINHPFGEDNTKDPIKKDFYKLFGNKHSGVDFLADIGTQVFASFPGIVVRKEFHQGMGNVLGTRYGNIVILYAHLSKFKVKPGKVVKKGEIIGLSGNSGKATTKPHLHFEMRDITKKELKDMVFNPSFNKEIKQLQKSFVYYVNNKNDPKNFKFLAKRYFGKENYWSKIAKVNPQIKFTSTQIIPQNTQVIIPNY